MSGYLTNLIQRTVERPASIRPRAASLFEPPRGPTVRVSHDLLPKAQSRSPRSTSHPREEQTAPAGPAELEFKPQPIYRSAEAARAPLGQAHERGSATTPPQRILNLSIESSRQALYAHPTVGSRLESVVERASTVPVSHDEEAEPEAHHESVERWEILEAARPPVERTPAMVIESTVFIERPAAVIAKPEVGVPRVDKNVRPDAPRLPAVIARPEVTAISDPPAIARETPSSVRVTIGRVDVRAIMPQTPPVAPARETRRAASLSLDEYLKQRNGA